MNQSVKLKNVTCVKTQLNTFVSFSKKVCNIFCSEPDPDTSNEMRKRHKATLDVKMPCWNVRHVMIDFLCKVNWKTTLVGSMTYQTKFDI